MAQANPNQDPRSAAHGAMAKAHSALANPQIRAAIVDIMKHEGQGDDTDIVHVNAQEEAMLKSQGGAGDVNPQTGLREYDPTGGSNAGGAGHAGDSGNNGGKGGGGSGTIGGGIHDSSDGTDDGNTYGSIAGMGYAGTTMPGSSTPLSDQNQNGTGWNNADAMARADVNDEGNSTMDNIGNFIGSLFGGYQQAPSTPIGAPMPTGGWQTDANWGVDPAGLVGGIAGAAFGIPGLGTVIGQISALLGHPFGINLGPNPLQGLSAEMNALSPADKAKVQAGINNGSVTPGAIGAGGGANNPGGNGNSAQQPLSNSTTPPPVTPPVTPPVDPQATYSAELAKYMPNLQNDFNFQAGQRGLDPTQYQDAYTSELNHRMGQLPVNLNTGTDSTAIDAALSQYLSPNFGTQALDDAQTAKRAQLKGGIDSKNFAADVNTKFGDTADQDILDKIYQEQFGQARSLLDNTKARGELNDQGYNSGLADLNNQGIAGKSKLQQTGNNILSSDRGTLNDRLNAIYNSIGGYNLGSSYDPTSDYSALQGKEGQLQGSLEGDIRGVAPSIFDTSTLLQKASGAQGATSSGSLLDTLAQRQLNGGTQNRGLGTTGSF